MLYGRYILISTFIFTLVFMSQIATYLILDATFKPNPLWIKRIAEKCGKDTSKSNEILNYKSVVQSGMPAFSYGAYLGILLHRRFFGKVQLHSLKTSFWKFVIRYLVLAVLAVPFAIPFLLIPWTTGLAILIIFRMLVPSFGGGFVIYAFS